MKVLTKQCNSCRYVLKQLPGIGQGWAIFPIIILQNRYCGPNSWGGINFQEFTVE